MAYREERIHKLEVPMMYLKAFVLCCVDGVKFTKLTMNRGSKITTATNNSRFLFSRDDKNNIIIDPKHNFPIQSLVQISQNDPSLFDTLLKLFEN